MEKVIDKILEGSIDLVFRIILAVLVIVIGSKLIKILVKKIKNGKLFQKIEKSSQTFISSCLSIVLKIIIFIIAITILGIPTTTIVTIVGSAGLALGLALQGGLSNIAGGLMIMIFKPFKVGDFIDTHADTGTVKEINIFNTVLVTPDNKVVVLPNGTLSNSTIVNYNTMKIRRLDLNISTSYQDDITKVKQVLENIIKENENILKDKDILVALNDQGSDALVYLVQVWVKCEDYLKTKHQLLEKIKTTFDKEGISIPYKQLDVHVINN